MRPALPIPPALARSSIDKEKHPPVLLIMIMIMIVRRRAILIYLRRPYIIAPRRLTRKIILQPAARRAKMASALCLAQGRRLK
jgi:hypothetical protein